MTYSQRSTHGAASSEITYLEYEIEAVQEEISRLTDTVQDYESMLSSIKSSPAYAPGASTEQQLRDKIALQHTTLDAARARLGKLQAELATFEE